MRILVTGGRNYGWKWINGVKVPDEKQIRKLNKVLDRAHSEFERRDSGKRSDLHGEPEADWTFDHSEKVSRNTHPFGCLSNRFTIIQGGASGADLLAKEWGMKKLGVVVDTYYADWTRHKKRAGPIRNEEMLRESRPNAIVAFPGGRGTAHMVKIAKKAGVPVLEVKDD